MINPLKLSLPREARYAAAFVMNVPGLVAQLKLEEKIREGAENMLHEFNEQRTKSKTSTAQRKEVIVQLQAASSKIDLLRAELTALGHAPDELSPRQRPRAESVASIPTARSSTTNLARPRRQSVDSSPSQFSHLFDSLDYRDEVQISDQKVAAIEQVILAHPMLRSEFAIGQMLEKLRHFMQSPDSLVLSIGFRLCRILLSKSSLQLMRQLLFLDWYLVRSLSRSDANAEFTERTQALQLIQAILDDYGADELSQGVIRAVVAVAESTEQLRDLSLMMIGEIALCDPQKAYDSGVLPVMLDTLRHGSREIASAFAYILCFMLDHPDHRRLLNNGKDLNSILAVFTGFADAEEASHEQLQTTVLIITTFLRSWAGLKSFDVRALVECLAIPNRLVQDAVMDIFCGTLGTAPDLLQTEREPPSSALENQFCSHVLSVLNAAGLYDQLYTVRSTREFHATIQQKALHLSAYMLRLSSQLSPQQPNMFCLPQTLQHKINSARAFDIPAAAGAVFQLNRAIRAPAQQHIPRLHESQVMQLGQDSSVWVKMGSQMDEVAFRNLIVSTNVLSTKTFTRWNWDALLELVQGPLHNTRRFEEACRTPKFMKRLVSFYRPFKHRFSSVRNSSQYHKYIHVGKELVHTLLSTEEGVAYLMNNKLLRQIAECLAQLDPSSGITSTEALLSSHRVKTTLTHGYFDILGVLSESSQGQNILSQMKIFNMLYNICDTDRTDVIRLFLSCLKYDLNGHPRLILAKALVRGLKPVRIFATDFLQWLGSSKERHLWVIDLLVTQLYDPDVDVCRIAVQSIQRLSADQEYLDHLISLKPSFEHLGPMGDSLYLVFMSRPEGYKFITEFDFVEQEMDAWIHGGNETYVDDIEAFLAGESPVQPRHFFGELVLTDLGAKLLAKRDYVKVLYSFIQENALARDPPTIKKLKGSMWALGQIASRPLGASLMCPEMIISVVDVFFGSQVYSVCGTAFYVLGLVACSFEGAEILNQNGWKTALGPFDEPLGVAHFVGPSAPAGLAAPPRAPPRAPPLHDDFDFGTAAAAPPQIPVLDTQILRQISDLSNQILANDASKNLLLLKPMHPEAFQSAELFRSTMDLLDKYRFKQGTRRFIFGLFDTQTIFEKLVKRRRGR